MKHNAQWHSATLRAQRDLSPSVREFEIRPERGVRPWSVGSHLDLRVQVDGRVRVDTHVSSGYRIPPHYDSLICKVIAHGPDRGAAIETMLAALRELVCEGVPTTVPMHQQILASDDFRQHRYDTRSIPGWNPQ